MNHIQVLDEQLINKIAAGEVVERPASVVKELIENSIDAKATKITIELQDGGRQRILISDNGTGMSPSDAELALRRHATSKIRSVEDLFRLDTMGFRGEALASISAVSRFTMMTCLHGSTHGIKFQFDGEFVRDHTPWQNAGGTTIICDDLFFNVPVRQKFLKAAAYEYGAVFELVQAIALAHPSVDFTLIHNGKETLRAPAVANSTLDSPIANEKILRSRFAQVMKGDAGLSTIYMQGECPYGTVYGLVSAPGVERHAAKDMFLFVNDRWVKDKSLRFAVLRGYHSHLLRGKYPVVALFVKLDPGLVDANVHPAKTEVRIQYANEIHNMVADAIRQGLRKGEWAASASLSAAGTASSSSSTSSSSFTTPPRPALTTSKPPAASIWKDVTPVPSFDEFSLGSPQVVRSSVGFFTPPASSLISPVATSPMTTPAVEAIPWSELNYLGGVADCYLMFSHGNRQSGARLLVVDQHAFHERILYERLMADKSLTQASQSLMVPEGLTLSHELVAKLTDLQPKLRELGFKFEVLDEQTIEVRAIPVVLVKSDLTALFESLGHSDQNGLEIDGNHGVAHQIIATMACHGAVRAGEALTENDLKILIKEASTVDFYHNCPHGRRVFRWWDEAQMARWFDRL